MKKSYLFAAVILAVVTLAGWLLIYHPSSISTPEVTNTATVLMKEDRFEPENLTVKKGTTVTFKNEDKVARWPASNIHPTHTIYPEFDPLKPIEPGQQWSFKFDKVGTWKDHDHLIPSIRGIITITE